MMINNTKSQVLTDTQREALKKAGKLSGQMRFACCSMIHGCGYTKGHRIANSLKRIKKVWRRRARRAGKEQSNEY